MSQGSSLKEIENENLTTEHESVDSTERTLSEEDLLERIQGSSRKIKEVLITNLEEGQYFGAYSLLNEDKPRPVSVFATKALEVIEVSAAAYNHMMRSHE